MSTLYPNVASQADQEKYGINMYDQHYCNFCRSRAQVVPKWCPNVLQSKVHKVADVSILLNQLKCLDLAIPHLDFSGRLKLAVRRIWLLWQHCASPQSTCG